MSKGTPGERLRDARIKTGKDREIVAIEIHKSESTIKAWELNQSRPQSFRDLEAVCFACGITVQEYVTGAPAGERLTEQEVRFLKAFRKFNSRQKRSWLELVESLVGRQ